MYVSIQSFIFILKGTDVCSVVRWCVDVSVVEFGCVNNIEGGRESECLMVCVCVCVCVMKV